MVRKKTADIDLSPECEAAIARLTAQAHELAAALTGDRAARRTGLAATRRSQALAMGMICYLVRCDPDDLSAAFLDAGSLRQFGFNPFPANRITGAPLAH